MEKVKATTVLGILHNGQLAVGADGQATMGNTVAKSNVKKIRVLADGKIVAGFAGSTADAFTLIERFEQKLAAYSNSMKRAAIELAKDWRTDRMLRRLEAMLVVCDTQSSQIISGNGDVLEPEQTPDGSVIAIGSGGNYALAAARALLPTDQDAEQIVHAAMKIAAEICVYTNNNLVVESLASLDGNE